MEPEIKWTNFVVSSVNSKLNTGHVIADKLQAAITKRIGKESYHCIWDLEPAETYKNYQGSVRPAQGIIWFDLDHRESQGELALTQGREFIKWLGVEDVAVFFSGSKGFHIGVPEGYFGLKPSIELPNIINHFYINVKNKFSTVDPSIHNRNRKFRSPGSKHPDTDLFKTRLTLEEFQTLTMDEIRTKAKNTPGIIDVSDIKPRAKRKPLPILELILDMPNVSTAYTPTPSAKSYYVNGETTEINPDSQDETFRPFQSYPKKRCIQRLFKSHAEEGTRHQIALLLIYDLKQIKTPITTASKKMLSWAEDVNYPKDRHHEITSAINKAYSGEETYFYSCTNPLKSQNCSAKCEVYTKLARDKRPFAVDAKPEKRPPPTSVNDETGTETKMQGFYKVTTYETGFTKTEPMYEEMADHCFEQKNMCFDDSQSLIFNERKWEWMSKNHLNNYIWTQNTGVIEPSHVDSFVKSIKSVCHIGSFNFQDTTAKINCKNGVVDVSTGEIEPSTYKYLYKYSLNVDYKQDAKCERWMTFLNEIFNGDQELITLIQEIFGYVLIGGDPFLHRAFVLYGTGRNGKSTLLDVLRAIVGQGSYSTVSMAKLDREFSIVTLDGKLANIVEETPTDEINAEVFKAMVGGGEVQAAHKGFEEFTLRVQARFLFACNDMPVFKDKSVGLADRLVFIPFERYFEESKRDTSIKEKLMTELDGILSWAIEGAKKIAATRTLHIPSKCLDTKEIYRKESDSVYAWFEEKIEVDAEGKGISLSDLHDKYKAWAEDEGHKAYGKNKFSKRLKLMIIAEGKNKGIIFDDYFGRFYSGTTQVRGYKFIFYK